MSEIPGTYENPFKGFVGWLHGQSGQLPPEAEVDHWEADQARKIAFTLNRMESLGRPLDRLEQASYDKLSKDLQSLKNAQSS